MSPGALVQIQRNSPKGLYVNLFFSDDVEDDINCVTLPDGSHAIVMDTNSWRDPATGQTLHEVKVLVDGHVGWVTQEYVHPL